MTFFIPWSNDDDGTMSDMSKEQTDNLFVQMNQRCLVECQMSSFFLI